MELTLFSDHACNLRCSYCYTGEKFKRRMSSETMRQSLSLALQTNPGHLDVSFFGGEPLLRPDFLREAIEEAERRVARLSPKPTLRFIINTNATLVDDEIVALLSGRRVTVFASLDGPRDLHDACRVDAAGKGSFDAVIAGLGRLARAKIPFQIVSVVREASADRLGEVLDVALSVGPEKLTLQPNFRDRWTEGSIARLERGLERVAERLIGLFRAGRAFPVDPLHSKILTHLQGGIPCPSRCQLGARELTVSPKGRLYPCAQMVEEDDRDELVIGTLATGLDPGAVSRLQRDKDRVEETCARCELRDRCQSHCGCRHIALSGKLGEITATLCETEAAFIAAADRVAETLFAEQNPTFLDLYYRRPWRAAPGGKLTQLRRSRDA
jgi:uncharacterized protein